MTKVGSSCWWLADFTRSGCMWAALSSSPQWSGREAGSSPTSACLSPHRGAARWGRTSRLPPVAAKPWGLVGKVHVWAEGIRLVKGAGPLLFTEVFGLGCLIFRQIWGISKENPAPTLWFYLPSSSCLSLSLIFAVSVRVFVHTCPPVLSDMTVKVRSSRLGDCQPGGPCVCYSPEPTSRLGGQAPRHCFCALFVVSRWRLFL